MMNPTLNHSFPKTCFFKLMKSMSSLVEFIFNNPVYKQSNGAAMRSLRGLTWLMSLLGIVRKSYFLKHKNLQSTSDMLITLLPSLMIKQKQMNFGLHYTAFIYPSNFMRKRMTSVYRFLMSSLKEQILRLKPVYTGNLPSQGIQSNPVNCIVNLPNYFMWLSRLCAYPKLV